MTRSILALSASPDAAVPFVHRVADDALRAREAMKPAVVVQIGESFIVFPADVVLQMLRECR